MKRIYKRIPYGQQLDDGCDHEFRFIELSKESDIVFVTFQCSKCYGQVYQSIGEVILPSRDDIIK